MSSASILGFTFRQPPSQAERRLKTFKTYQSDLQYTDVVIVCGDGQEVVHAHAVMLRAVSGFMEAILADFCPTSMVGPAATSAFIYLPDFSADCIRTFIEMLYTGKAVLGSFDVFVQVSDLMAVLGTKAVRLEKQPSTLTVQDRESNRRDRTTRRSGETDSYITEVQSSRSLSNETNPNPPRLGHDEQVIDLDSSYSNDESLTSFNASVTNPGDDDMIGDYDDERASCDYELVFNAGQSLTSDKNIRASVTSKEKGSKHDAMNAENCDPDEEFSFNGSNSANAADSEVQDIDNSISTTRAATSKSPGFLSGNNPLAKRSRTKRPSHHEYSESLLEPNASPSPSDAANNSNNSFTRLRRSGSKSNDLLRSEDDLSGSNDNHNQSPSSTGNDTSPFDHLFAFSTPREDYHRIHRRRDDRSHNPDLTLSSVNSSSVSKRKSTRKLRPDLACPLCPRIFSVRLYLQHHCAEHFQDRIRSDWMAGEDTTKCPKCDYTTTHKRTLVRHIGTTHRVVVDLLGEMGISSEGIFKQQPKNANISTASGMNSY